MGDVGALTGAILAGGHATRLGGTAKGLHNVGGMRIIDRVAAALDPLVGELLLVANAPDAAEWLPRARLVRDVLDGGGSAAGLHAAIRASGTPVLLVAWDMPFVTTALLAALAARARAGIDAVVPAGARGAGVEPLCAWYAPACAAAIESAWAAGERSMHSLLARLRSDIVPSDEYRLYGDPERMFFNVNTHEDLEQARAKHGLDG